MRRSPKTGKVGDAGASRRGFLKTSAVTMSAAALGGTLQAFLRRLAKADGFQPLMEGYGPLRPVADETTGLNLLQLPDGFRYLSYGWRGDEMTNGQPTPPAHDGMAIVREESGVITLCRNHEINNLGTPFGPPQLQYDAKAGGGCTSLQFDAEAGRWRNATPVLSGTVKNCAGGPTPWGTWLSCEETVLGPGDVDDDTVFDFEHTHGWIFEVPPDGSANPTPLKAMGRFVHEAVAVDPETGYVYETEDRGTAGFYRFIPNQPGRLAEGGRLQMLKAEGVDDLRTGMTIGQRFDVAWVDIEDVERRHSPGTEDSLGVYSQGKASGGSTFARLEGCWYGSHRVYAVSTSGGNLGLGQVWEFDPPSQRLTLIFESPGADVIDSPDNISVSPRGGLVVCEDGDSIPHRIQGMTPDGRLFPFAANNIVLAGERNGLEGDFRADEWAGPTFSADGEWLFVNNQTPGITFAITGPWGEGLL